MSRNLESPIRTQMAVAAFKAPLVSGDYQMEGKPSCWRRIFVQTENGSVLGMELDRSDNARTIKKRLQLALNIPIEESYLTFGDTVLKNDLSAVQNDYPVFLTRNLMQRSSSTPCLSPTGQDTQQTDRSGPIEILGYSARTKHLVKEVIKAMKNGVGPVPVSSGLGGAYYFKNIWGESIAIVKPTDEEPFAPNNPKGFVGRSLGRPGLKRSVRVGETGFREVAAYLLDHGCFASVPPTSLVKITHSIFNVNAHTDGAWPEPVPEPEPVSKIASFQEYVRHDFDAGDHGTSSFPVAAVHRIGILDVRILNTDRHAGNLLVRKASDGGGLGRIELIPIDHGLCLPETLEDPYFEWIHWPQASIPFSDEELEYIRNLDPVRDSEMLRSELPMLREACLRVLFICTTFLKKAATYGLCLAEIGEMMSREFHGGEERPSELEFICIEARRLVAMNNVFPRCEVCFNDSTRYQLASEEGNGCAPLEDQKGEANKGKGLVSISQNVSKLSSYQKSTSFGEENRKFSRKQDFGGSSLCRQRSANGLLPTSVSFVKLGDMNEDEWGLFLNKFEELLSPAFSLPKSASFGLKQRQRLGSSCQF